MAHKPSLSGAEVNDFTSKNGEENMPRGLKEKISTLLHALSPTDRTHLHSVTRSDPTPDNPEPGHGGPREERRIRHQQHQARLQQTDIAAYILRQKNQSSQPAKNGNDKHGAALAKMTLNKLPPAHVSAVLDLDLQKYNVGPPPAEDIAASDLDMRKYIRSPQGEFDMGKYNV